MNNLTLSEREYPEYINTETLDIFFNALKHYLNTRSDQTRAVKVFCTVLKLMKSMEDYVNPDSIDFEWFSTQKDFVIQLSHVTDSKKYEAICERMTSVEKVLFSTDNDSQYDITENIQSINLKSQALFNGTHVCTCNIICFLPADRYRNVLE